MTILRKKKISGKTCIENEILFCFFAFDNNWIAFLDLSKELKYKNKLKTRKYLTIFFVNVPSPQHISSPMDFKSIGVLLHLSTYAYSSILGII